MAVALRRYCNGVNGANDNELVLEFGAQPLSGAVCVSQIVDTP